MTIQSINQNLDDGVSVTQGTSPWVVTGTVTSGGGTVAISNGPGAAAVNIQDGGNSITVDSPGLPTALGQTTMINSLPVVIASNQSAIPISGNIGVTGTVAVTQSTSPWVVSGTVAVSSISGTVAVTQSTSPWVVSGTVTANAGTGNFNVVQPTGSLLQTTANQGGSWTVAVSNINDATSVSGSITSTQTVFIPTLGYGSVGAQISGTWTGTIIIQGSVDESNLSSVQAYNSTTGLIVSSVTANAILQVGCGGLSRVSFSGSTVTSGTASITLRANQATAIAAQTNPLPAGTATIGSVTQGTTPWVDNITQFGGSNVVTGVGNSGSGIPRVTVSSDSNITNISGTISLPTGAATSANQSTEITALNILSGGVTSSVYQENVKQINGITPLMGNGVTGTGSQRVTIASDNTAFSVNANAGTNLNTSALALDTSVNGLLLAQGSTTSGQLGPLHQAAVTTGAPTYTTGKTNPLSLTTAGGLRVDGSGSTQPISGTVTANAGTNLNTSALALESGGNLATLAGGVTSSVYQENVKQINGVVPLMGNGVTGTGSQRVTIASDNTAFSVNANAGTNLNTSALALDATLSTFSGRFAATTATVTRVNSSASSVQLLASNAARKNAVLYNESTSLVYVKFGTTASATDYTIQLATGQGVSLDTVPIYSGRIDAIWASANGAMQCTEY